MLANRLKTQGASTLITPDGPAGPLRQLKKGVLHIAQQSGLAVVPIRFRASRTLVMNSWDNKPLPLPFGHIHVFVGEPIPINDGGDAEAATLTQALNGE